MYIGDAWDGSVNLDNDDMYKHMTIIGGGENSKQSSKYAIKLIAEQIELNRGALIIEKENGLMRQAVQANLERVDRSGAFLEITEQYEGKLLETIYNAINKSKIILIELDGKSTSFVSKFYKAMDDYVTQSCIKGELKRLGSTPFLIFLNQVERNTHPVWIKLLTWGRKSCFMVIGIFDGFECIESSKANAAKFHQFNVFVDCTSCHIAFKQQDVEMNNALALYLGLPRNLPVSGLRGLFSFSGEREHLLEQVSEQEAVAIWGNTAFKIKM